jgi:hypothetical protein
MSEKEKIFKITNELRQSIIDYLENPFDNTKETLDLLKNEDSLTIDEINQIISLLGKFPAYSVYPIINEFKGNLKIEEIENK